MTLPIVGERSHHRHHAILDERGERLAIYLFYIAYPAVVHRFNGTLIAENHIHVGTAQAYGVCAIRLQERDHTLVYQSGINHGHHINHLIVGDATAFHHSGFDAESGGGFRSQHATTVHHHLAAFQFRKVTDKLVEGNGVFHHLAPNLYQ